MDKVRLDKWMWAVRLFKTRSLAAKACESGRVKTESRVLKASTPLRGGERLELPFAEGPGTRVIIVRELIEKRVSAPLAKVAAEEVTEPEVLEARRLWSSDRSQRKSGSQGRPTKKDRREIDQRFFE